MLKKTLFLLLLSLIYSQIVNLIVFQSKEYDTLTINETRGLICYEFDSVLETNEDFYFDINCNETGQKMNKTLFYNLTDISCKHLTNLSIDFNNLESEFTYSTKEPKTTNEENGFFYEYNITKKEDKQKYMLLLFNDFTGKKFTLTYIPFSATKMVIVLLCILLVSIFIILSVFKCLCKCRRRRRHKSTDPQFEKQSQEESSPSQMMSKEKIN